MSYVLAAVLIGSAVVVLDGSLLPPTLPQARMVFGTVLLLLGIYRIVVTLARRRAAREEAVMAELRAEARAEVRAEMGPAAEPSSDPT